MGTFLLSVEVNMFSKVLLLALVCVTALVSVEGKTKKGIQAAVRAAKKNAPVEVLNYDAKRQISHICNDKQFNCSAYSCISNDYVCDTEDDCYNSRDEQVGCPTDCTGPHQFQCQHDASQCISQRRHCDGSPDCADWSDEANCAEFDCLDG